MFIPYSTEALIKKWPITNFAIIAVCVLVFAISLLSGTLPESMVLDGWNPVGLLGHMLLHANLEHIIFNMLYLWVFGNAINAKMGNWAYAAVFLASGLTGGVMHNIFDGNPAIGASGAVNGVVGFFLVLYPVNGVNCFYLIFIRPGTVEVRAFWLILVWFALDAVLAFLGVDTGIAYWAHVGGFLCGFALGIVYVLTGLARMDKYDNPTLIDIFGRRSRRNERPAPVMPVNPVIAAIPRIPTAPPPRRAPPVAARPVMPVAPREVNIDCPHCGQNMDVPMDMLGTAFNCPACNGVIVIET